MACGDCANGANLEWVELVGLISRTRAIIFSVQPPVTMDLTKLETIVSSRKLPQSSAAGRRRKRIQRRVTPVTVNTTTARDSLPPSSSSPSSTAAAVHGPLPQPPALASYNTTIGFLESRLLVKQRFPLSDTLYILIGLDIDTVMHPTIYIIDKRLWMQIEITPDCFSTITYYQQRLHDFYVNARPGKPCCTRDDIWPVNTEKLTIKPSMECETALSLARRRAPEVPNAQEYGTHANFEYACWNNIDDYPVPAINMTQEEWVSLSLQMESIIEYYHLCTPCTPAALRLVEKYVNDFKLLARHMVVAAALQSPMERAQVRDDVRLQLPAQIRNYHHSRLIINTSDYDRGIVSPFGSWLDAEVRAHCNEIVTKKVMDELSKEFSWLKITD